MLRSMKELDDYTIGASDGCIGHVKDFLFDDQTWVIRYFVVETGSWLLTRKVLISPIAIRHPDWGQRRLPVSMTREQVRNSPDIDTDKPVSRQHEADYLDYFGYPAYWAGGGLWGAGMYPHSMAPGHVSNGATRKGLHQATRSHHKLPQKDDPHLRSCKAVVGYHIHASDGDIGHVWGLLVDEQTWAIRYLVVDTSSWWLGHKVLIAPEWIEEICWIDATVTVDLSRQSVKDAPPYDSTEQLNRQLESGLYRHHQRPNYWHQDEAGQDHTTDLGLLE